MRLEVIENGQRLGDRIKLLLIAIATRRAAHDVVKTILYRKEFFGTKAGAVFQSVMRGPSPWPASQRELFAAFVSKRNECEF
jgi:hypothetical protein